MSIDIVLQVLLKYGIPVAEQVWKMFSGTGQPTQADWDTLRALGEKTGKQQLKDALLRNGIDPESDQGKALLALY
jgi:hypothetical protein